MEQRITFFSRSQDLGPEHDPIGKGFEGIGIITHQEEPHVGNKTP